MELPDLDPAIAFLERGDDFLLTAHINSDGDAIGGCLGLRRLLRQMGKSASIVLHDPPDPRYEFLAGFGTIQPAQAPPARTYTRAVVLDCPHLDRIGDTSAYLAPDALVLNLDHHPGNDGFGTANLVTPTVSSSCEMIFHLARAMGLELDKETATQLYAGIIYDTGGFRYSLATPTTFEAAAELVRRGIRFDMISERVFHDRSYGEVKQLGQAIDTLALHFDERVATMHLTHEQMGPGDPEDVVNYGLMIRGVEAALLLKEQSPGQYRVSLRARDLVDVSEVAAVFGGGGHAKASGCRMEGTLDDVRDRLLAAIAPHLN